MGLHINTENVNTNSLSVTYSKSTIHDKSRNLQTEDEQFQKVIFFKYLGHDI